MLVEYIKIEDSNNINQKEKVVASSNDAGQNENLLKKPINSNPSEERLIVRDAYGEKYEMKNPIVRTIDRTGGGVVGQQVGDYESKKSQITPKFLVDKETDKREEEVIRKISEYGLKEGTSVTESTVKFVQKVKDNPDNKEEVKELASATLEKLISNSVNVISDSSDSSDSTSEKEENKGKEKEEEESKSEIEKALKGDEIIKKALEDIEERYLKDDSRREYSTDSTPEESLESERKKKMTIKNKIRLYNAIEKKNSIEKEIDRRIERSGIENGSKESLEKIIKLEEGRDNQWKEQIKNDIFMTKEINDKDDSYPKGNIKYRYKEPGYELRPDIYSNPKGIRVRVDGQFKYEDTGLPKGVEDNVEDKPKGLQKVIEKVKSYTIEPLRERVYKPIKEMITHWVERVMGLFSSSRSTSSSSSNSGVESSTYTAAEKERDLAMIKNMGAEMKKIAEEANNNSSRRETPVNVAKQNSLMETVASKVEKGEMQIEKRFVSDTGRKTTIAALSEEIEKENEKIEELEKEIKEIVNKEIEEEEREVTLTRIDKLIENLVEDHKKEVEEYKNEFKASSASSSASSSSSSSQGIALIGPEVVYEVREIKQIDLNNGKKVVDVHYKEGDNIDFIKSNHIKGRLGKMELAINKFVEERVAVPENEKLNKLLKEKAVRTIKANQIGESLNVEKVNSYKSLEVNAQEILAEARIKGEMIESGAVKNVVNYFEPKTKEGMNLKMMLDTGERYYLKLIEQRRDLEIRCLRLMEEIETQNKKKAVLRIGGQGLVEDVNSGIYSGIQKERVKLEKEYRRNVMETYPILVKAYQMAESAQRVVNSYNDNPSNPSNLENMDKIEDYENLNKELKHILGKKGISKEEMEILLKIEEGLKAIRESHEEIVLYNVPEKEINLKFYNDVLKDLKEFLKNTNDEESSIDLKLNFMNNMGVIDGKKQIKRVLKNLIESIEKLNNKEAEERLKVYIEANLEVSKIDNVFKVKISPISEKSGMSVAVQEYEDQRVYTEYERKGREVISKIKSTGNVIADKTTEMVESVIPAPENRTTVARLITMGGIVAGGVGIVVAGAPILAGMVAAGAMGAAGMVVKNRVDRVREHYVEEFKKVANNVTADVIKQSVDVMYENMKQMAVGGETIDREAYINMCVKRVQINVPIIEGHSYSEIIKKMAVDVWNTVKKQTKEDIEEGKKKAEETKAGLEKTIEYIDIYRNRGKEGLARKLTVDVLKKQEGSIKERIYQSIDEQLGTQGHEYTTSTSEQMNSYYNRLSSAKTREEAEFIKSQMLPIFMGLQKRGFNQFNAFTTDWKKNKFTLNVKSKR